MLEEKVVLFISYACFKFKTSDEDLLLISVSWNVDSYFYQTENITALSSDNTCDFCGKVFTTKMSCRDHRNAVHLQVSYPCEFCGKKFPYKRTKRRHQSFCLAKFGQSSARWISQTCSFRCFFFFLTEVFIVLLSYLKRPRLSRKLPNIFIYNCCLETLDPAEPVHKDCQ